MNEQSRMLDIGLFNVQLLSLKVQKDLVLYYFASPNYGTKLLKKMLFRVLSKVSLVDLMNGDDVSKYSVSQLSFGPVFENIFKSN